MLQLVLKVKMTSGIRWPHIHHHGNYVGFVESGYGDMALGTDAVSLVSQKINSSKVNLL
jgi:hypothetical protein